MHNDSLKREDKIKLLNGILTGSTTLEEVINPINLDDLWRYENGMLYNKKRQLRLSEQQFNDRKKRFPKRLFMVLRSDADCTEESIFNAQFSSKEVIEIERQINNEF